MARGVSVGLNSGRLYGTSREAVSTRSMMTRDDQAHRLRSSVSELSGDVVPGIVNCVLEVVRSAGDRPESNDLRVRGHQALVRLRTLVDHLSQFVLEPPTDPIAEKALAAEIVAAYREFASAFEDLGFRLTMSDSLGVFLARKLDSVILRLSRFYLESDAGS
jgi:hypothetical protein